jgi:hypothetical protein
MVTYDKTADSRGTLQALVPGKGEKVDSERFHVYGQDSCSLRSIYQQKGTGSMSYGCHFSNGQYGTGYIAGMNDDHQASVEVYCSGNIVYVEAAIGGTGYDIEDKSSFFQSSQRSHYGIMLHRAGDNTVAGLKQTF